MCVICTFSSILQSWLVWGPCEPLYVSCSLWRLPTPLATYLVVMPSACSETPCQGIYPGQDWCLGSRYWLLGSGAQIRWLCLHYYITHVHRVFDLGLGVSMSICVVLWCQQSLVRRSCNDLATWVDASASFLSPPSGSTKSIISDSNGPCGFGWACSRTWSLFTSVTFSTLF